MELEQITLAERGKDWKSSSYRCRRLPPFLGRLLGDAVDMSSKKGPTMNCGLTAIQTQVAVVFAAERLPAILLGRGGLT